MTMTAQDQQQLRRLDSAAETVAAAAEHYRKAVEAVRSGDTPQAYVEERAGFVLLQSLLPHPVMHHAAVPLKPSELLRELKKNTLGYLKLLLPIIVVLGGLYFLIKSGSTGDVSKGYSTMSGEEAAKATAYPRK